MRELEKVFPLLPQVQEISVAAHEPSHTPVAETLLQQLEEQRVQLEIEISRRIEAIFAKRLEAQKK